MFNERLSFGVIEPNSVMIDLFVDFIQTFIKGEIFWIFHITQLLGFFYRMRSHNFDSKLIDN